jgi:hypothetical protein
MDRLKGRYQVIAPGQRRVGRIPNMELNSAVQPRLERILSGQFNRRAIQIKPIYNDMGESLTQTNAQPAAAHADISNSGRIRTNLQAFMKIRNGR